jgi:hypothetical protein
MFGFSIKPRKNTPPYVKMEGSFTADAIESITTVTKANAQACAQGNRMQANIPPAGGIQKIFSPLVTRVVIKDGPTYFFELINQKEFINAVKEDSDGRIQGV